MRPTVGDALAGLSVALVLVPQSLAYAVLAGMPPRTGLVVAAVATIAAAPFVSSVWLQTGPVAITSLLTAGALAGLAPSGSHEYLALAALLALLVGAIRVLIGLLRAGALAYLMSQPVLAGFLSSAALVIAASQLPAALGAADAAGGSVVGDAVAVLLAPGRWDPVAVALTTATVALVLGARRLHPLVPGVLVAVVTGIAVSRVTGYAGAVVGDIPSVRLGLQTGLPWGRSAELLLPAAVIALVGFAEAAAIARSYATRTRTRWSPDREFFSQGIANVASGLFGGFPAGGSFSRSAVGRLAGAGTAWSGAFAGMLVLAFLPFAGVLAALPKAVLAGIIIAAVAGLMRPTELLALRRLSPLQFGVGAATFALTLALAPRIHVAVAVGVGLAVLVHLRRELVLTVRHWVEEQDLHVRPIGVLYFGSAPALDEQVIDLLSDHPAARRLVLHLDGLGRVDVTGALQVRELAARVVAAGLGVVVTDLTPVSSRLVRRVLPEVPGVRID